MSDTENSETMKIFNSYISHPDIFGMAGMNGGEFIRILSDIMGVQLTDAEPVQQSQNEDDDYLNRCGM